VGAHDLERVRVGQLTELRGAQSRQAGQLNLVVADVRHLLQGAGGVCRQHVADRVQLQPDPVARHEPRPRPACRGPTGQRPEQRSGRCATAGRRGADEEASSTDDASLEIVHLPSPRLPRTRVATDQRASRYPRSRVEKRCIREGSPCAVSGACQPPPAARI
jgi:hypothetical protein